MSAPQMNVAFYANSVKYGKNYRFQFKVNNLEAACKLALKAGVPSFFFGQMRFKGDDTKHITSETRRNFINLW